MEQCSYDADKDRDLTCRLYSNSGWQNVHLNILYTSQIGTTGDCAGYFVGGCVEELGSEEKLKFQAVKWKKEPQNMIRLFWKFVGQVFFVDLSKIFLSRQKIFKLEPIFLVRVGVVRPKRTRLAKKNFWKYFFWNFFQDSKFWLCSMSSTGKLLLLLAQVGQNHR